ncbi:hypothetical protein [Lactiplantibacillus herbarum]|uniref:hypothetical protein n=1 Tax=Lactiplantibacillus herbarum TaxID=1670446 RepID=UPI00064F751D|nr:hypothetical protein [Lactiplantibacillus herbarum]
MMPWLVVRLLSRILFGIGLIYLFIQIFQHNSKKLALSISIVGFTAIIISFFGCLYYAPSYAHVNVDRNNYKMIQRATTDEHKILLVTADSDDDIAADGQQAAKDLINIIMHLPRSSKCTRLRQTIYKDLYFDVQLPVISSFELRRMVNYSNQIISESVTQKHGSSRDRKKIFKQMNQDAEYQ